MLSRVFYIFLVVIFAVACKHKTNFNDFPVVSYSITIEPIIVSNCTQSSCHGNGGGHESFPLLSYDDLIKHCNVIAGNPDKSGLYTITNTYYEGTVMPPKPYNKLTEKQIEFIYVWIGQGAKNN